MGYAEDTFQELQDDLGYSQSHYRKRNITQTLTDLFSNVYLYLVKQQKSFSIRNFYQNTVPEHLYYIRKYLFYSLILTLIGVAFGYFAYESNPSVARDVMGDVYVDKTLENIEKGDPLAIYKSENAFDMFTMIALNNLKVAVLLFVLGSLISIGSILVILINAVMIGVFAALLIDHGEGKQFFLTVFQHGTLEILSMIIEGACGLAIGLAIFNPGKYSKKDSLKLMAKSASIVIIGTFPIIVLAAFIESYLTRFTNLPDLLRLTIIALSLTLMTLYVVILPLYRFRNNKPKRTHLFAESRIVNTSQHLERSWLKIAFIKSWRSLNDYKVIIVLSSIFFIVSYFLSIHFNWLSELAKAQLQKDQIQESAFYNRFQFFNTIANSMSYYFNIFLSGLFSKTMLVPVFLSIYILLQFINKGTHFIKVILISLAITLAGFLAQQYAIYIYFLILPFLLFFIFMDKNKNTIDTITTPIMRFYGYSFFVLFIVFLIQISIKLSGFLILILIHNLRTDNEVSMSSSIHITHVINLLATPLMLTLLFIGYNNILLFVNEQKTGAEIKSKISKIAKSETAYGLEVEN